MSERRAGALGVLGFVLVTATARATLAQVVSLDALEKHAVDARASLAAEQARLLSARARVAAAGAPFYPTLSAVADAEGAPGSRLVSVRDEHGDSYLMQGARSLGQGGAFEPQLRFEAGLQLEQRIYDFGRTGASLAAARAAGTAQQAELRAARLRIIAQVRDSYLSWLAAHEARGIARQRLAGATELREMLEGRVAVGTDAGAELASARYAEALAGLALSRAESRLAGARAQLEQAAAEQLPSDAEPDVPLLTHLPRRSAAPEGARIRALELQRDAALGRARAASRAYAPLLAARAEAGVRGQDSLVFPQYRLGLSLSVLLSDGGAASAASRQAQAQAAELAAEAREARASEQAGLRLANSEMARGRERLRLAQQLESSAAARVDQEEQQLRLGVGAPELLVQAEQRLASARLEVLSARVALARAQLELGAGQHQELEPLAAP